MGQQQRGHRLRLVLSSQSLGEGSEQGFLVADPDGLTAPQRATVPGGRYTIFLGPDTPTALHIPQLPFGAFPEAKSAHTPTSWNELTRDFDASGHTIPIEW